MTPVDTLGEPVTVVDTLGEPVVLINNDGTPAFLAYSAKTYLGGVAPYHWLDFINNRALYAGADVGNVTQATGYSFTRASDGYYTNSDGTLTSFASGALRRGDRGVLIEGARTNLCLQSQTFDNASWSVFQSAVSADQTTAPDGTSTADKLTELASLNGHQIFPTTNITVASATAHTFSVFAKAAERSWLFLEDTQRTSSGAWFQLSGAGTVGTRQANNTTATITALANGWYRCSITYTTSTTTASTRAYTSTGDGVSVYTGVVASGLYIWGAQLEAASFPSSYVKSEAAASTRAADVLTYTAGVSYPLSLWAEFERSADTGGTELVMVVDDGDLSDYASLTVDSTDRLNSIMVQASSSQGGSAVTGTLAALTVYKGAVRFNTNSIMAARGGTLGLEDTVATLAATPTTIRLGAYPGGINYSFQYLRRIAVFNSALTDAQLQTTTS
jgi:hypothetical protein